MSRYHCDFFMLKSRKLEAIIPLCDCRLGVMTTSSNCSKSFKRSKRRRKLFAFSATALEIYGSIEILCIK